MRQAVLTHSEDFIITSNVVNGFGVGIQFDGTVSRSVLSDNIVRGNTG